MTLNLVTLSIMTFRITTFSMPFVTITNFTQMILNKTTLNIMLLSKRVFNTLWQKIYLFINQTLTIFECHSVHQCLLLLPRRVPLCWMSRRQKNSRKKILKFCTEIFFSEKKNLKNIFFFWKRSLSGAQTWKKKSSTGARGKRTEAETAFKNPFSTTKAVAVFHQLYHRHWPSSRFFVRDTEQS